VKRRTGNWENDRTSAARHGRDLGWCTPCGKYIYATRKAARRVRNQLAPQPHRGPLSAYPCPHTDGWWHLGHLPLIPDARNEVRASRAASLDRGHHHPATTCCTKETCCP
jgi:hypothetical protein